VEVNSTGGQGSRRAVAPRGDDCYKCTQVFMSSTCNSYQILIKLEFSRQFSEKSSSIKFYENPSNENRFFSSMQMDRRDGTNSRLSQFRECA
jgi:hypothetical protein